MKLIGKDSLGVLFTLRFNFSKIPSANSLVLNGIHKSIREVFSEGSKMK